MYLPQLKIAHSDIECDCVKIGAKEGRLCNKKSGKCRCKRTFMGKTCDKCKLPGQHFPNCTRKLVSIQERI